MKSCGRDTFGGHVSSFPGRFITGSWIVIAVFEIKQPEVRRTAPERRFRVYSIRCCHLCLSRPGRCLWWQLVCFVWGHIEKLQMQDWKLVFFLSPPPAALINMPIWKSRKGWRIDKHVVMGAETEQRQEARANRTRSQHASVYIYTLRHTERFSLQMLLRLWRIKLQDNGPARGRATFVAITQPQSVSSPSCRGCVSVAVWWLMADRPGSADEGSYLNERDELRKRRLDTVVPASKRIPDEYSVLSHLYLRNEPQYWLVLCLIMGPCDENEGWMDQLLLNDCDYFIVWHDREQLFPHFGILSCRVSRLNEIRPLHKASLSLIR